MRTINPRLSKAERIVCAYAKPWRGQDLWLNAPLWLIVRGDDGVLREECMQPEEQSKDIQMLYATAAAVHAALLDALHIQFSKAEDIGEEGE